MPSRSKQEAQERAKTLSATAVPRSSPPEEAQPKKTATTIMEAAIELRNRKRKVDSAIEEASK